MRWSRGILLVSWLAALSVSMFARDTLQRVLGGKRDPFEVWDDRALMLTLCIALLWGVFLGRSRSWSMLLPSALAGAVVVSVTVSIMELFQPSGGEGGYGWLNFIIYLVVLAILLGAGCLLGLTTRRIAGRPDRSQAESTRDA
ncbi:hypothetical protein [Pedococcus sp. 5OH_020]|uniref:hypothetical protein n=1 Tax=Pedococcus sp. 5OH_020 TaxID=2989814 RepID=UPI0022EA03DC|nr:hypothetical protein [Pedococcus sp. 5OH_020]